jgi:hypothetical protein
MRESEGDAAPLIIRRWVGLEGTAAVLPQKMRRESGGRSPPGRDQCFHVGIGSARYLLRFGRF